MEKITRKKIVMVMGVQRSGTTALFDALSHGRITAFNEGPQDEIYDDFYLRPEAELRALFDEVPGAILLKPISETFRRSVRQVFEEYAAYDLYIVWIYRDPVNATHSIQRFGFNGPVSTVPELAEQWKRRNRSVLEALPRYGRRITIVCYEDLARDPSLLTAVGERIGIEALADFRGDSGGGRRNMAPELQTLVDAVTRKTRTRMDAARSIQPSPTATKANPAMIPPPTSGTFEAAFARDPLGQVREARERASVHRLRQPNTWAVLRYDDVAASLGAVEYLSSVRHRDGCRSVDCQDPSAHARLRRLLEPHLTPERIRLYASRIEQHTRSILAKLARGAEFDLVSAFALRLTTDLSAECSAGLHRDSLLARVTADPRFTSEEISDLRRSISRFLRPLTKFLGTAAHYLLFHPGDDAKLRTRPADIPPFVDEMMRLFPPCFAAQRFTWHPVVIGGTEIPPQALIYFAIFAANRDPAHYSQPDEMIPGRAGPPHLSFSDGSHAWLARRLGQLERETVLRVLLSEFPPLRPCCPASAIRFAAGPEFYVPAALPVRFDS